MDYVFELEPIEGPELLPQLSAALQARTELVSRAQYPKMWRITDRLGAVYATAFSARRCWRWACSCSCRRLLAEA